MFINHYFSFLHLYIFSCLFYTYSILTDKNKKVVSNKIHFLVLSCII